MTKRYLNCFLVLLAGFHIVRPCRASGGNDKESRYQQIQALINQREVCGAAKEFNGLKGEQRDPQVGPILNVLLARKSISRHEGSK
jgi:hypothetical protein